ncbi:hypothetical protein Pla108_33510 [Botrimarina colliarenosi]|uniref:HEAT repeat protein n=1 Tax=Botrimarina colliarenosi TaxID=2528001 RepID=A0A5C6A7E2_9BACT|nr:hypothetical protein [Botrimarina colliarenosi]TWT95208.1 hypothetical protein Pla108_33510 [Botrimarina colliarenosi]
MRQPLRLSPSLLAWLRLSLVGAVLATLALGGVWRVADSRLDAEARRLVLEGGSAAVAATRDDWPTHVMPVALTDPGEAGVNARNVASAKLNQALSQAQRGSRQSLQRLAPRIVAALNHVEGELTDEGSRWAEWVARQLAIGAQTLEPAPRISLLADIDTTLTVLAQTPRLAPVVVASPPTVAERPRPLAPAPVAEPVPSAVVQAEPTPVRSAPQAPAPAAVEPAWLPPPAARVATKWRRPQLETTTELTQGPATSDPLFDQTTTAPADLPDLPLLAEALRLTSLVPSTPTASGPTRAPSREFDASESPEQRRLAAVQVELQQRGYGAVSRGQVEGLLASNPQDRVALVNRLLTDQGGDPARVLLTLASDESAAVRAAAISALGSSSSRQLVEKAFELASQDPDVRVGALVEPIRDRLR